MSQRLIAGELDAMITDISDTKMFENLEHHPKIKRLFPDYVQEDLDLYNDTGILHAGAHDRHEPQTRARATRSSPPNSTPLLKKPRRWPTTIY